MAVDRSKFKRTTVAQMQQADKDLNQALGKKKGMNDDLELDEGVNLLRLYPAHPRDGQKEDEADPFMQPMVMAYIPAMVPERDGQGNILYEDQAKKRPKMKKSVKPIFNSKIHGGTPKDLVEEYIKLTTRVLKETIEDEAVRKQQLDKVYGNFSKGVNGINYQTKFVAYVDKYPNANPDATPVFGRIKLKQSVKDRLNKIGAVESANDPMGTEPFTDVEEGRAIKVMYDPKASDPKFYYVTEIDNSQTVIQYKGKPQKVLRTYPLSDEQLERFMNVPSLYSQFVNTFTRKDFEYQALGLEMFDRDNKMGIWETPEWADILEEIDSYYPEVDETAGAGEAEEEDADDTEENEAEGDDLDLMSRAELIQMSKDNKMGIIVKPTMSDTQLRDKIREWRDATEEIEDEIAEEAPPEEKPEPVRTGNSVKDRLNKMKNKGKATGPVGDLPF